MKISLISALTLVAAVQAWNFESTPKPEGEVAEDLQIAAEGEQAASLPIAKSDLPEAAPQEVPVAQPEELPVAKSDLPEEETPVAVEGAAIYHNPIVSEPQNQTYRAGEVVDIAWSKATTGYVNIDLYQEDKSVLAYPIPIAHGVPAEAGHYAWEVPKNVRTANGYRVMVWGVEQPKPSAEEGNSEAFTVLNGERFATTSFVVTEPNNEVSCKSGKTCKIRWDFDRAYTHPADVDVAVYREGQTEPVAFLGTVPADKREVEWQVPETLNMNEKYYVSVSGSGQPQNGPNLKDDMGANSEAFSLVEPPSEIILGPGAENKKIQERKEAEEKRKSEAQAQAEAEEQKKKDGKLKAACNAATSASVGKAAVVLAAAAALFAL